MRRMLLVLTLLALLAVPLTASAQFGPYGPGGIIASSQNFGQAQVTSPTGAAQTLLSQTIGAGALSTPFSFHGRGNITGKPASPGSLTLTVKLGTGAALTVVNAQTIEVGAGTPNTPFTLDCDFNQQNTTTAPIGLGAGSTVMTQQCIMQWMPASGTSDKVFWPPATQVTLSLTTNIVFLISVTFTDTTNATGITMQDWRLVYGG